MAPKKAAAATTTTHKKNASHPPYKEMVTQALADLKSRNGVSRQAIKKYIHANFQALDANADIHINQAIKRGAESGDFMQPKGASGPVKLAKKIPKKKDEKSETTVVKSRAPAAAKKAVVMKKAAASKKTSAPVASKANASSSAHVGVKVKKMAKTTGAATKTAAATERVVKKTAPKAAAAKASTKTTSVTVVAKKAVAAVPCQEIKIWSEKDGCTIESNNSKGSKEDCQGICVNNELGAKGPKSLFSERR
ncbi:hypothetical protein BASA61_002116 [Batrachochytrium salamandrivorans]|nr:hypothetical protein BASA61_002116 [Batrachochytrium salamandrivorans]